MVKNVVPQNLLFYLDLPLHCPLMLKCPEGDFNMFARIKKSGKYEYLRVVENRREGTKVNQRAIATLGRLDQMHAKGEVETLVRSLVLAAA
jgi:hypothetical protein